MAALFCSPFFLYVVRKNFLQYILAMPFIYKIVCEKPALYFIMCLVFQGANVANGFVKDNYHVKS